MIRSSLSTKERYNIIFFISLFVISFSALIIMVSMLFINSPDALNLKRPVPYLLLPIYLVIRLIFLKIEVNKSIDINKTEEIVKLLLFVYFLVIISVKFFPLDKQCTAELLAINFLSFNTLFSIKPIIKNFIENFILFMPLGFLMPIIMNKFRSVYNCAILSLIFSIAIYVLQMILHFIGIYLVDIISLDSLFINIIGTLIGYSLYCFISNYNLSSI